MPLVEGQVIAGYTVVRPLGAGGMGEVYLAQHPRLPRQDALKVLAATVCADSEYRVRFNREAEIAAKLWHPHIVQVHDRGDVDGQLWIAMDFVEGTDAGRLLAERYPDGMPPALVARLITAVGEALDYAHQRGLTHRDIKPANILISDPEGVEERIMLADFGIARRADDTSNLTGTNMTVGTVSYAAPEQLCGEVVDGRADQYALAATAYQLLTGAPPFAHSNPAVVISQHLTATPPPIGDRRPELSSLGSVFDKALAKKPDARFAKCVDFAHALSHRIGVSASDSGATVRAPASGPRHAKASAPSNGGRGHRLALVGLGAVLLLALVAVAVFFALDDRKERGELAQPLPSAAPKTEAPVAQPPVAPVVPVVVVGADCDMLGAAGVTEAGAQAYCARVPSTGSVLWSLQQGEVPSPTAGEGNVAIGICMEQTGDTSSECQEDIARENADPAANDTALPTPTS